MGSREIRLEVILGFFSLALTFLGGKVAFASNTTEFLPNASQMILVLAEGADSSKGEVLRFEKTEVGSWKASGRALPVVLGKNGLASGKGLVADPIFDLPRAKMEGDGRSPSGVFALGKVYGRVKSEVFSGRMPYQEITPDWIGIDDPKSSQYNRILDRSQFHNRPDWSSHEELFRKDGLYHWLLEIGHNPVREPGRGSLIFLHVWRSSRSGTAGCVAMEESALLSLLRWLDPLRKPHVAIILKNRAPSFLKLLGKVDPW